MHEQPGVTNPLTTSPSEEDSRLREGAQTVSQTVRREGFARYQKRRAENTVRRQKADLALFEQFLAEVGVPVQGLFTHPEAWNPMTFSLVEHFLEWQLEKGYAIDTINIHLSTIKKYAALACQLGVLSSDELFRIREVKGFRRVEGRRIDAKRPLTRRGAKKATPTFLTEGQLASLFQVPDLETRQGWRDLLLLRLLYDLGLRPGEVVSLQIADLDLQQATLHVRRHKTGSEQVLRLTPGILTAAAGYLELHGEQNPTSPLLVKEYCIGEAIEFLKEKDGSAIIPSLHIRSICGRVHQLGKEIGVDLNAYDARHQWARDAVDADNALVDILTAGGWSKDSPMVRRYSGERVIANERIHLKRDMVGSDSP